MLKPLALAAALTLGSAALATAAPIPPTPDLLTGSAIVSPIRHVRDSAPLVWGSFCQASSPLCGRGLLDRIGIGLAAVWTAARPLHLVSGRPSKGA